MPDINSTTELEWFCTPCTIGGFSLSIKQWGKIMIDDISDIKFDDTAFDRLVLEPERKDQIKALVFHTQQAFTDIITGKGAGVIFLLHGPPGVGKTLTAESIAELLKRPLYSVTVGELGTDPKTLEQTLSSIIFHYSPYYT